MRGLLYLLASIFLAVGFIALGADAYWSWKAHAWTFESIGAYLDRLDPRWPAAAHDWAAHRSVRWSQIMTRLLSWPVWGPAFVIGGLLALPLRRR